VGVISVAIPSAGGYSPRHNVSGHQWTEVNVPVAGGVAVSTLIGSFDQVLNVKTWTPDQDDEEVLHGHSVNANIEALLSEELEILYDVGTDFDDGTYSDMTTVGDNLVLQTSPFVEDWEGTSPLDDWSPRFTGGGGTYYVTTFDGSECLYMINWNDQMLLTADNGPYSSDVEMRMDVILNVADIDGYTGPTLRVTGSGSACRGYWAEVRYNTNWIRLNRITGDGTWTTITYQVGPKFFTTGVWYTIMFKVSGTSFYYKVWARDTESEPGSWSWLGSDSTHAGPGDVGIFTRSSSANENWYFDNFSAEAVPPAYVATGNWESGVLDLTSVDHYSHGIVSWEEVVPSGATLAVKCRWPDETAWRSLTNGAILPHIEYENDMRAGSTFHSMELRVEMTSTGSVTAELTDLRVYFEPCRQEELKIVLDGKNCVPDDNTLINWGRALIGTSGNPPTLVADWSDLFAETNVYYLGRDLETITAVLKYWDNTIDSITFETEGSKYRHGYLRSYWIVPATPFYSGPAAVEFTTLAQWHQTGKVYEWVLTDKGLAIHADARWLVGHAVQDDHPMSIVVAVANLHEHPLSLVVKGYARDDHPLSMLIQGWRLDDNPLSVVVGEWTINDQPVSMQVGLRYLNDHPMSYVVYGVNREGSIVVNVIDDNTYQTLLDHGITFS
jgi:hypothetical protein